MSLGNGRISPGLARFLRVLFLVGGSLAALLAVAVVVASIMFQPPDMKSKLVIGVVIYGFIAAICFYAAGRLRFRRARSDIS